MSKSRLAPFDPQYPNSRRNAPTSEALRARLQADLDAFRARGGCIEVLAITRPLDRNDAPVVPDPPAGLETKEPRRR